MFVISLAATLLLAGAESAQATPVETAAPAAQIQPATAEKPKMRKVCREDPAYVGTRLAKKVCKLEPMPEQKAEAETNTEKK
jgi:hypothetical protein